MLNKINFDVLDPVTKEKIGVKSRSDVHRGGDWHRAVNAFIFRESDKGDYQMLAQRRSEYVDIAQNHSDQSLATQLIVGDRGGDVRALFRGLSEELGIKSEDVVRYARFCQPDSILISKRYCYNKDLWNRELVNVFGVVIRDGCSLSLCEKIEKVQWMDWGRIVELIQLNPEQYTKTLRLYTVNNEMREKIMVFFHALINQLDWVSLHLQYEYYSGFNKDVVALKLYDTWIYEVYNAINSIKLQFRKEGVKRKPFEIVNIDMDFMNNVDSIGEHINWRHT